MQHSIVPLSEIYKTFDLRMDAEYWRPSFIKNSHLVSKNKKIKDFITQDISNIKSSPINKDFEYLEISNISLNSFEYESIKIQEGKEPKRAHYILKKDDIVVSTVRPNRNAVALIDKEGIVGSSGLSVLRVKNIEPEWLFAFCKTNYFINCLMRENKASMYPAVSNKNILETALFVPSGRFREKIKGNIQKAVAYAKKSKILFAKAQAFLLSELGLTHYKPKHQLFFIKQHSDIEREGRMDAEYFQPKYEEIVNKIKAYKGGWDRLGNLVRIKKGIEVGRKEYSEQGIPFVRVSNLRPQEIIEEKYISNQLHSQIKEHQLQTGEILLTKDASPGIAYHFLDGGKQMTVSSGILRLQNKSDKINNDCLTFILNSVLIKEQINRDVSGFVILHWNPDQVKQTLIPILSKKNKIISKKR